MRIFPLVLIILFTAGRAGAENALLKNSLPDYVLGTGDMVRIQVYNEEDLYLESRVSELKVSGLTPGQLENRINLRLKGDYLINPKVSVDILEYRQFYVNGEVKQPGGFPFQPGITVRKAISVAGGFKERASREKINIIHDTDPTARPTPIRLDDFIRPGDIITVEESFF